MKIIEADVVWTPAHRDDCPGASAVRVERHGTQWQRTPGDYWMPAASLGAYGEVPTKGGPVKQLLGMFSLLNTIVVRDTLKPRIGHSWRSTNTGAPFLRTSKGQMTGNQAALDLDTAQRLTRALIREPQNVPEIVELADVVRRAERAAGQPRTCPRRRPAYDV